MSNLITWGESAITGTIYGSTIEDMKNDDLSRYSIDGSTVKWCESGMNIIKIRCASVSEAKQLAELAERGRVAEWTTTRNTHYYSH